MDQDTPLLKAQFDPKYRIYAYVQGLMLHLVLISAIIGIVSFPIWVVIGWWVVNKEFETMSATLTENSIHLKKGVFNRLEKTIPLDKVVDVALRTGPLLRMFGLATVQIETAGSNAQGTADMVLKGIVDAEGFRNAVLTQRKIATGAVPAPPTGSMDTTLNVLTDIRDSLQRIEQHLESRSS